MRLVDIRVVKIVFGFGISTMSTAIGGKKRAHTMAQTR